MATRIEKQQLLIGKHFVYNHNFKRREAYKKDCPPVSHASVTSFGKCFEELNSFGSSR